MPSSDYLVGIPLFATQDRCTGHTPTQQAGGKQSRRMRCIQFVLSFWGTTTILGIGMYFVVNYMGYVVCNLEGSMFRGVFC